MKTPRYLALISTLALLPCLGLAPPASAAPAAAGGSVGMVIARPLPSVGASTLNPNEQPLMMQISAQPGGTVLRARTSSSVVQLEPINCSSAAILKDPKRSLGIEEHQETLVEKLRVGVHW